MNALPSSAGLAAPSPQEIAHRTAYKAAMRHLVGGVSIVTAAERDDRAGLTASSLTSLSAEPPSLLVCIARHAYGLQMMRRSGRMAVSVLGHGHQAIADRFAGRDGTRGAARFEVGQWIGRQGHPPVLADALASFECEVDEMLTRYSHTIVIGRVVESRAIGGDGALVYWRAAYERLGQPPS